MTISENTERNPKLSYDDGIVRLFVWATIIFGVIGMVAGVLAALQLAWWPANLGLPWTSFGRIRPVHTNAVVFAFAGNAFFVALYYSLQRLLKTRMYSDLLSRIHFWGWQFIILLVAITLPLGMTRGKEYAEAEWPIAILITVIWVVLCLNVFFTLKVRRVQHLYVAIWFYLASLLAIAMLHIVNALVIPLDWFKSYSIYSGVQDALVQWWYGHNAVGFLLTTPFLGLMYYFVPKACGQPVYSYRLSIIHFWSLVFIYIWAGPHHLLYSSLPEWAQSLGMVFSLMLLAPSWGGMINGLLTMRGTWDRLKSDPVLKFFLLALTFYGMATLEGSLLSIKSLNLLTHDTDYTIAHVHGGGLGWVGGMVFGMLYYLAPRLWQRELYSKSLAHTHFWLATIGILLYVSSMWVAGLMQGLMWFATDKNGYLLYPQFIETVEAIKPLYWARLIGGTLYLVGAILCLYNLIRTALAGSCPADETFSYTREVSKHVGTVHEKIEHRGLLMGVLAFIALAVGGLCEFIPAFLVEIPEEKLAHIRPYTALELEGRDVYIEEGCSYCHTQMVRTYAKETLRYGPKSEQEEFIYDHPFLWGSKRTGPDLHRVGGKYPDLWHYRHMKDPRSISPGSVMPSYAWLESSRIDRTRLSDKLDVMRRLGVPYSAEEIKTAESMARQQAEGILSRLSKDGVQELPWDSKLLALIAYLQRLGVDRKNESVSQP
ncbi:MAG: cytochrome-c oxidase, cbb3-type subunit I [Oligoflexales bacterium]|nr:cytochrome-c oxidase, cbb3-type subunit I [Oligoflexales bacterium]